MNKRSNIACYPKLHLVLKVEIRKLCIDGGKVFPCCLKGRQILPLEQDFGVAAAIMVDIEDSS